MSDCRAIGVFDSGLGGLTVVRHLVRRLPGESIVYFGDTARVPYGTKTDETILKYSRQDAAFLLSHNVKMVIAACGTASSVAGTMLRQSLGLPFEEMILVAAEAAAAQTQNRRIGVLGTPATIRSRSHETALRRLLPDAEIHPVACPLFVPLVENGFFAADNDIARAVVRHYLEPLAATGIDTVILGCTHYPLLREVIQQQLGAVTIIDPGEALAQKTAAFLTENGLLSDGAPTRRFFVSDCPDDFERFASAVMPDFDFGTVSKVSVENF